MVDLTPMLVVRDVPASSKWYQGLLELTSAHGGDEFEMLVDDEGKMQLFLHHRDFGEHPGMSDPREGVPGRGVLLYVSLSDVEACFRRAVEMRASTVDEPHANPIAQTVEFTVKDPDGYAVTVSERRASAS